MGSQPVALRSVVSGCLVAVLLCVDAPALATPPPVPDGPVSAAELPAVRENEGSARTAARRSGRRVEVASRRTETMQVFVNPSGTLTVEQSAQPARVRLGNGWVPPDTRLRAGADGTVRPAATAVTLALSGGGAGPLVRMARDGKELAVGWPGLLPAPVLSGDTATYPSVLPEVDLVVRVAVDGFSHVLVVKTPSAAANPRLARLAFPLSTVGVTVRTGDAGSTIAVDGDGTPVFGSGTAMMWDSSSARAAMQVEVGGGQLVVSPDLGLLRGSGTRFPVYIDPTVRWFARSNWTHVNQASANQSYWSCTPVVCDRDVAKAGYSADDRVTYRSFFEHDTDPYHGAVVTKATFRAWLVHSWSCSDTPTQLYRTGGIGPGTTWNNTVNSHWPSSGYLGSASAHACSGDRWMEWLVTGAAQDAADNRAGVLVLGLKAADESNTNQWKKFDPNRVGISVEYNLPPRKPANVSTVPWTPCGSGDNRVPLGTGDHTFTAYLSDSDTNEELFGYLNFWRDGRYDFSVASGWGPNNRTVTFVVPESRFVEGVVYSYAVNAGDRGGAWTASDWCEVQLDRTPPSTFPAITSVDGVYPRENVGGGVGVPGVMRLSANGETDIAGFEYWLHGGQPARVAANAPGGYADIMLTPASDAPQTLFARNIDRAGNRTVADPTQGYDFFVAGGVPAPPRRAHDFTGDGRADVGFLYDHTHGRQSVVSVNAKVGGGFHTAVGSADTGQSGFFGDWRTKPFAGDFDGDGRTDAAVLYDAGGCGSKIYTMRANGVGFDGWTVVWDGGPNNWCIGLSQMAAADFTGDGRADILGMYNLGNNEFKYWVWVSTGPGFAAPVVWWHNPRGWADPNLAKLFVGDFDGDGRAEPAHFYSYPGCQTKLWVSYSTGTAFRQGELEWDSGVGQWCWDRLQIVAGDFTGDGWTDVAAFYRHDDATWTLRLHAAAGAGFAAPVLAGQPAGWSRWDHVKPVAGDFNGDGRADIGHFYRYPNAQTKLWVLHSTGAGFGPEAMLWDSGAGQYDWTLLKTI